ncbi:MAG TPA: isoaspartyl peptidase/L-asparaginase, partial [Polyangiaceae bacterium]|nr:isoaspartyl peptidase/L-asparaginase [Polyangiaceae bacterium]
CDAERIEGCRRAALSGAEILRASGSALDAVQTAVRALEDNHLFNAGTGACLTEDGLIELDAGIMEGTQLRAGAVCALPPFRNPIDVARAVMEEGRHVLYASEGAAAFARRQGFEPSTSEAMTTDRARRKWEELRKGAMPASAVPTGTVGAVARDPSGRIAAATSTGGILGKKSGRVGDSPVIGAGTFADDEAGGASSTGQGEGILRTCLAKTAIDDMRRGLDPETASRRAIDLLSNRVGAQGGIILVDAFGRLGLARSTPSMAWGAMWEGLLAPVGAT